MSLYRGLDVALLPTMHPEIGWARLRFLSPGARSPLARLAPAPTGVGGVVTLADVARIAGVGWAAVAAWRRRHDDFPAPAGGTSTTPAFERGTVGAWLLAHDKITIPGPMAPAGRLTLRTGEVVELFDAALFGEGDGARLIGCADPAGVERRTSASSAAGGVELAEVEGLVGRDPFAVEAAVIEAGGLVLGGRLRRVEFSWSGPVSRPQQNGGLGGGFRLRPVLLCPVAGGGGLHRLHEGQQQREADRAAASGCAGARSSTRSEARRPARARPSRLRAPEARAPCSKASAAAWTRSRTRAGDPANQTGRVPPAGSPPAARPRTRSGRRGRRGVRARASPRRRAGRGSRCRRGPRPRPDGRCAAGTPGGLGEAARRAAVLGLAGDRPPARAPVQRGHARVAAMWMWSSACRTALHRQAAGSGTELTSPETPVLGRRQLSAGTARGPRSSAGAPVSLPLTDPPATTLPSPGAPGIGLACTVS